MGRRRRRTRKAKVRVRIKLEPEPTPIKIEIDSNDLRNLQLEIVSNLQAQAVPKIKVEIDAENDQAADMAEPMDRDAGCDNNPHDEPQAEAMEEDNNVVKMETDDEIPKNVRMTRSKTKLAFSHSKKSLYFQNGDNVTKTEQTDEPEDLKSDDAAINLSVAGPSKMNCSLETAEEKVNVYGEPLKSLTESDVNLLLSTAMEPNPWQLDLRKFLTVDDYEVMKKEGIPTPDAFYKFAPKLKRIWEKKTPNETDKKTLEKYYDQWNFT